MRIDAVIEVSETIRVRAEERRAVFANLRDRHGNPYHPACYDGSWSGSRLTSRAASLGSSFAFAIRAFMTPPGSSSGSVGGGSGW